jgi:AcrR family transcriptional regulator
MSAGPPEGNIAAAMKTRATRVQLAEVVRDLPRRSHDLSRKTVRTSQRIRLLEAVIDVAARVGYAQMAVADVIAVANVSRKTFYEHFRDKEDCFLAAYDFVADRVLDKLVSESSDHRAGAPRRRAQVTRFLQALADDPLVARAFVVDVLGAGPRTLRRREVVNARFGDAILGSAVDPVLSKAIIGGVNTVCGAMLLDGRAAELPGLADVLVGFLEHALGPRRRS